MTGMFAESLAQRKFVALLLTMFAGSALALAMIGIYGLVSYAVLQRTREIGVRIALGATRGNVLWMILRQAVLLGGLGILLGTAGALGGTRLLRTLLFGVTPRDPFTFSATALLLLAIALVATLVPALRAAHIDPSSALRSE
jgi:putative ABC transport system permease protein